MVKKIQTSLKLKLAAAITKVLREHKSIITAKNDKMIKKSIKKIVRKTENKIDKVIKKV